MKLLPLRKSDLSAQVSDEDFDHLSQFKWYIGYYGYPVSCINKKTTKLHQYVYLNLMGRTLEPTHVIDHDDRDKLNSCRENLEGVSRGHNASNRSKVQGTTSKYFGVSSISHKWCVQVKINSIVHREHYHNEHHAAHAFNLILDEQNYTKVKSKNEIDPILIQNFKRYAKAKTANNKIGRNGEELRKGVFYRKSHDHYAVNKNKCKYRTFKELKDANEYLDTIPIPDTSQINVNDQGQTVIELFNKQKEKVAETIIDKDMAIELSKYRWHLSKDMYVQSHINGKVVLLHRFVKGYTGPHCIDHDDSNTLNNQDSNLNIATRLENARNRRSGKNSSSKYVGVSYCKRRKKWRAQLKFKEQLFCRYFLVEEDAARYRDSLARQYFGSFARLNFPNDLTPVSTTVDPIDMS